MQQGINLAENTLSVREIGLRDIELIAQYWYNADNDFLEGIGVDITKMPPKSLLMEKLEEQVYQAYSEKDSYCMIWELDGKAIGHSNVNKIIFGEEASMHLHIWYKDSRTKGFGVQFIKMGLPYFFKNLQLKKIYSEPYSLNESPNKALERAGFKFVKTYTTIPGLLNFEQPVNRWEITEVMLKATSNLP